MSSKKEAEYENIIIKLKKEIEEKNKYIYQLENNVVSLRNLSEKSKYNENNYINSAPLDFNDMISRQYC